MQILHEVSKERFDGGNMTNKEIAVIVSFVAPYADLKFVMSSVTSCFEEILGEKLVFFVKFVSSALQKC